MFQGVTVKFVSIILHYQIQAFTSSSDWLAAEKTCNSEGGTLAKIESAAENTAVLGLMGDILDVDNDVIS